MDERISGNNLVYAQVGYADEGQILDVVTKSLERVGYTSEVYINVVANKGTLCKYAYLWFTNLDAFNFITSFESKGTTSIRKVIKVEEIVQPKGKKPTEATADSDANAKAVDKEMTAEEMASYYQSKTKFNWFDDDEDDIQIPTVIVKSVFQDVPYQLDKIQYTDNQVKWIQEKYPNDSVEPFYIAFNKGSVYDIRPPDMIRDLTKSTNSINSVSTSGGSGSDSEESGSNEPELYYNKWIGYNVPDFVDFKMIQEALKKYVTDPTAKGKLNKFNGVEYVKYPHINIKTQKNGNKSVYVTWNPNSTDGMFALAMCRQVKFQKADKSGVIRFNHLKKRD
jgi:hypothetical protein